MRAAPYVQASGTVCARPLVHAAPVPLSSPYVARPRATPYGQPYNAGYIPPPRAPYPLGGPPPPRPSRNPVVRWWRALRDPSRPWWRRALTVVGGLTAVGVVLGVMAVGAVTGFALALLPRTPDAFALTRATVAQPTMVYASGGQRLTRFEPEFRERVPLDSIPQHLVDALIATEDRRFYAHGGVDVRRTVGALWATAQGDPQGGSTITQQLVRNLFPEEIGNHRTPTRKVLEAFAAMRVERGHTKREILESYLNTVPFLYNAYGVELAARTYFGTTARGLTVPQAATLVAMLKGPSQFNPVQRPEAALARRNLVLGLMHQQGTLSADDLARYTDEPLGVTLRPQPGTYSLAPHFTAAVRREAEAWARPRGYDLDRDGLVIRTTLDLGMQRAAEAAVAERGERLQGTADREWRSGVPRAALDAALQRTDAYRAAVADGQSEAEALASVRADRALVDSTAARVRRVEASLVALDPATGEVLAYVGSRDFARDEYDRAGVALRQPGSTFKAFVYAAALQRGYAPRDEVEGGNAEVRLADGTVWRPEGGSSGGTLADAFAYSKNAVAVRLTQEVGPHRVALVAQRMGITSELDVVPSIGLGTSPVTLLEMVSAYGTVAADGVRRAPRLITRIETADGRVLESFRSEGAQALTRRDARHLLDMMRGTVDRGTGTDLRAMGATGDLAGKTGTTQRHADGWFIGMRPGLVVGAWVGFNDQRLHFRSMATGAGGKTALPVVGAFLRRVQDRLPDARFPPSPDDEVRVWAGYPSEADAAADENGYFQAPDVQDYSRDDYETSYGENPEAPAPREPPRVERPEAPRPPLRSDVEPARVPTRASPRPATRPGEGRLPDAAPRPPAPRPPPARTIPEARPPADAERPPEGRISW